LERLIADQMNEGHSGRMREVNATHRASLPGTILTQRETTTGGVIVAPLTLDNDLETATSGTIHSNLRFEMNEPLATPSGKVHPADGVPNGNVASIDPVQLGSDETMGCDIPSCHDLAVQAMDETEDRRIPVNIWIGAKDAGLDRATQNLMALKIVEETPDGGPTTANTAPTAITEDRAERDRNATNSIDRARHEVNLRLLENHSTDHMMLNHMRRHATGMDISSQVADMKAATMMHILFHLKDLRFPVANLVAHPFVTANLVEVLSRDQDSKGIIPLRMALVSLIITLVAPVALIPIGSVRTGSVPEAHIRNSGGILSVVTDHTVLDAERRISIRGNSRLVTTLAPEDSDLILRVTPDRS
jgi:hypothetical protein